MTASVSSILVALANVHSRSASNWSHTQAHTSWKCSQRVAQDITGILICMCVSLYLGLMGGTHLKLRR
jgi:hypothetical protein